ELAAQERDALARERRDLGSTPPERGDAHGDRADEREQVGTPARAQLVERRVGRADQTVVRARDLAREHLLAVRAEVLDAVEAERRARAARAVRQTRGERAAAAP